MPYTTKRRITRKLTVSLTEHEYRILRAMAEKVGILPTQLVNQIVIEAIRREGQEKD